MYPQQSFFNSYQKINSIVLNFFVLYFISNLIQKKYSIYVKNAESAKSLLLEIPKQIIRRKKLQNKQ